MATYLATVQIGRYADRAGSTRPVPTSACRPSAAAGRYDAAFGRPARDARDVRPAVRALPVRRPTPWWSPTTTLEIPLESQGLSTFGANFLHRRTGTRQRLVAHELAHQWFGNSLTARHAGSDIWLHEGFACYAEWLWSEESGGRDRRSERAARH